MTRKTFGHWELDTVQGGKNSSTSCLFTMTERKSRNEIAGRIANSQSKSIVEFLDHLERKMGSVTFRKIVLTLICDGGNEFMDIGSIEKSCIDGKPRTPFFFAHPYATYERGTNENHNRMLRRFFQKVVTFPASQIAM